MRQDDIITAPVGKFCQQSGLGHTKVYELLRDGALKSIKVGKRRLIVLDSYRLLIARQLAEAAAGPTKPLKHKPRRMRLSDGCDPALSAGDFPRVGASGGKRVGSTAGHQAGEIDIGVRRSPAADGGAGGSIQPRRRLHPHD